MTENAYTLDKVAFKAMDKTEKYNEVANYITRFGKLPSTNGKPDDERTLGQFWTNAKAASKREGAKQWELDRIAEIMNSLPNKNSRMEKIKTIIEFCSTHNKTPSQSSLDDTERKLSQSLNGLKILAKNGKMSLEEAELFATIHKFRSNYQKPRSEKLKEILAFCNEHKHTPRQHVKDNETEKRMAELLSTTKALLAKDKLDAECTALLKQILDFAPMSRMEKLKQLQEFVAVNKYAPKVNSNNSAERQLSTFLTKMKAFMKSGKLNQDEITLLNTILTMANVKSRMDKLNDLYTYTQSIGHYPKLNTDDEEERKFAMFFTNIKQCRRVGKLTEAESAVLTLVEEFTTETVSV